jgi:membrane-associated protease RseP (regulator of RpoE activity)
MRHQLFALLLTTPLLAMSAAEPAPTPAPAGKEVRTQGFLGIQLEEVDEALTYHLELKNDLGVLVAAVAPGGAAAAMGLKPFDVIVAADGEPIYTPRAFSTLVRSKSAGQQVQVTVRRGARSEELVGTLAARPAEAEHQGPPPRRPLVPGLPRSVEAEGPKRGTMTQPDGSTMEWSIEESPEPPTLRAP